MKLRYIVLAIAGVLAVALVAAARWHLPLNPLAGGGSRTVTAGASKISIGGPFTLVTQAGKTVTDATFRGKYLLVYFGYTYCPDVCPTELAKIATVLDRLGPLAAAIQPLFVTVDPARDSPSVLASYVPQFYERLIGLTGTPAQIARIAKAYHVYYAKVEDKTSPGAYSMDHSAAVYLMGPKGEYLTMFSHQTGPDTMVKTLREYVKKTS